MSDELDPPSPTLETPIAPPVTSAATTDVDLDAVERDLTAVEAALTRLADGTYWTDEVTGESLSETLLVTDPTARRA